VPHFDERFAADADIGVPVCAVGEEVECRGYGTVGAVFEGDDAVGALLGLDGGEDVTDFGLGAEGKLRKGLESGLDVVLNDVYIGGQIQVFVDRGGAGLTRGSRQMRGDFSPWSGPFGRQGIDLRMRTCEFLRLKM